MTTSTRFSSQASPESDFLSQLLQRDDPSVTSNGSESDFFSGLRAQQ
jgi:hypothetical protein